MDIIKEYISKYKNNDIYLYTILQTILVYYDVRKGALVESLNIRNKNYNAFMEDWMRLLGCLKLMVKLGKTYYLISKKNIHNLKDRKAIGNFLEYQCATNELDNDEIRKKGKIVISAYIEKPLLSLKSEVLLSNCKKNVVKVLKHYQEFIEKANKVLQKFGYNKSIIRLEFWKNNRKQHETWIK